MKKVCGWEQAGEPGSPDSASCAPVFTMLEGFSAATITRLRKKKPLHQPFLITRKRPISKMPADFHIPPPSSLKHDVISPLQYNKYFTFKSRFIKRSPGGRNNKVSLYSPNKTAKDIFYNLYFWLWVEIIHISFSVRGPKWCCISRLAEE